MKLGILGKGMIVKDVMNMYNELNIEKTYIYSRNLEEGQKFVEDYNLDGVYTNYDEMLESDIDVIYCALPNHLHYSFCLKALQAKKHCIIEKPITANSKECKHLMDVASENNCMIFEAMNIHALPSYLSIKEDIQKLGNIKMVVFNYSQYSSRYNKFKEGIILPAFDYHCAGGALMDINVYNIHALMGLFGKPLNNTYMANIQCDIDTSGMMLFDYGTFKATCIGAKDCGAPVLNTIQGDLGCLIVEGPLSQATKYTIKYNDGTIETKEFENKHRLVYEFKEFIKIIEENNQEKQQALLNLSYEITKVMEKGRKQEGIVFDNDK